MVSWQIQHKFFKLQTSYQSVKIQMVFHFNENDAHNILQIKIYYTHQAIKHNVIQESKGHGS